HFYTGGTTGKPKGVVHTHRSLSTNAYSHLFELDISGDERLLLMTPLTHSAGAFMWASLLTGAESVVRQGFEPERALSDIASYDTSSLKTLIYGAAPMTPARLREGIDEFGAIFKQFYGQTEVPNLITTLGKKEHALAVSEEGDEDVLSSAGQDCLMNRVRIVDPETGEEVEDGDEGEIVVSSPYTMEGYYEMPDETQETLKDGWLHTGDVGKKDSDGYVYLLDRKSNMIITGGMNVYSTEVEEELDEHPDVKEVAVIGIPDDKWGEAVTAVVVPRDDGLTADEIKEFADGRLADYKKPKNVEFVNSIPKTPYGKMDKKALREPYWEEEERDIR
ncbi:MAG: AMP-binding protein, partial [Halobacteria archaeon]|nr:AMP-binding protein [Halobacteria archaeon]